MPLSESVIEARMRLRGARKAQAESKATAKSITEIGAAAEATGAKSAAAGAGGITKFQKSMKALRGFGSKMKSLGSSMTTGLTLPLALVGGVAIKTSLDFDRSMRNVNSIAQLPEKRFGRLKEQVLGLAGPTAQAPTTLSEGLYDLVSSGFQANESIGILKRSALAASAGLTTTEISTKAVAAALNAYHLPAKKAGIVSDQMFETVNRGVVTFEELAGTIGDVLPFAAQLHVGLGQVGAGISTMTKEGLNSAEATTRYKNVLVTLIKPQKDLVKRLKEMGTSGEALVKKKGLQGALESIIKPLHGNKEAIAQLFPNIRALGGVLALTGINAKSAKEDLGAFHDVAGSTNKVLKEQEKSSGFQLQRSLAELKVVGIELGNTLLPIVVPALKSLAGAVKSVLGAFNSLPAPVRKVVGVLLLILAVAGPIFAFIGTAIIGFSALGDALAGMSLAAVTAAAPVALIIAGIVLLGIVIYESIKHFDTWGKYVLALISPIAVVAVLMVRHWDDIKKAVASAVKFIVTKAKALPGLLLQAVKRIPHIIGWLIGFFFTLPIRIGIALVKWGPVVAAKGMQVISFLKSLPGRAIKALIKFAPTLFHIGIEGITKMWNGLESAEKKVRSWFTSLPGKIWKWIKEHISDILNAGKNLASELLKGIASGLPGPVKDLLGISDEEIAGTVTISPSLRNRGGREHPGGGGRGSRGPHGPITRPRPRITNPAGDLELKMWGGGRGRDVNIHVTSTLDGKVVARNTAKHTLDAEARR